MEYTDVQSDQDAIRLIADYLEEVATQYPEQEAEQIKKSVWFAIGYLQG